MLSLLDRALSECLILIGFVIQYDIYYAYSTTWQPIRNTDDNMQESLSQEEVVTSITIVRGKSTIEQLQAIDPTKRISRIDQSGYVGVSETTKDMFAIPPPPRESPFPPSSRNRPCLHITITVAVCEFLPHCPYDNVSIHIASIPPPTAVASSEYKTPSDVIFPEDYKGTSHYKLRFPLDLQTNGLHVYLEYYCTRMIGHFSHFDYDIGLLRSTPDMCRVHLEMLYKEMMGAVKRYTAEGAEEQADKSGVDKETLCSDLHTLTVKSEVKKAGSTLSEPPETSDVDRHVKQFLFDEIPFQPNYEPDLCSDTLWCSHTNIFQKRLDRWQNPPILALAQSEREKAGCLGAKFIVFEPDATKHGIGSMLAQIAVVLRFALCHNRILHLVPPQLTAHEDKLVRWTHPQCKSMTFLECYFKHVTNCSLSLREIDDALILTDGRLMQTRQFRDARVVRLLQLPTEGHCTVCGSAWTGSTEFFDGLHIGVVGFVIQQGSDHMLLNILEPDTKNMTNMVAFMERVKLPWMAQMIRYILRPRIWFSRYIQQVVKTRIYCNTNGTIRNTYGSIPHPYASLHVRYGEKVLETESVPLDKYMRVLKRKASHIKNIFVSTETERILEELARYRICSSQCYLRYT